MAKTQALNSSDLIPTPSFPTTTRQRGVIPSAELVPMQFKMPPEFVHRFKVIAANDGLKLNQLLVASLEAYEEARAKK